MTIATGPNHEVTSLLTMVERGDRDAIELLYPLVLDTLHARAVELLAGRRDGGQWQPTAVVSEAYWRLIGQRATTWQNRQHFHQIAAIAMRRIVSDWARHELRQKRGGGRRVSLPAGLAANGLSVDQVVCLDELLELLGEEHARSAKVVELRCFGGMLMPDVAEALAVSQRTVEIDWQFARTWLHKRIVG